MTKLKPPKTSVIEAVFVWADGYRDRRNVWSPAPPYWTRSYYDRADRGNDVPVRPIKVNFKKVRYEDGSFQYEEG